MNSNNAGQRPLGASFTTSKGGKPLELGGRAPSGRRVYIVPPGPKVLHAQLRDPNDGQMQLCFDDTLGVHVTVRLGYYSALRCIEALDGVCRTYEGCLGMTRETMRQREPKPTIKYVRPNRAYLRGSRRKAVAESAATK